MKKLYIITGAKGNLAGAIIRKLKKLTALSEV